MHHVVIRAVAAAVWLGASPLAAQDSAAARPAVTVRGRVVDARTLAPVADALVALVAGRDTVGRATADTGGYFVATLATPAARRVAVHFRRAGYRVDSLVVDSVWTDPLRVAMTPLRAAAVALAPTRVTAARSAVEERVRRAGGAYIGQEEIARRGPARTSDLLRTVRGVTIREGTEGVIVTSARNVQLRPTAAPRRTPSAAVADSTDDPMEGVQPPGGGRPCVLRVGVDGHLMPEDYSIDDVAVNDIAAIEVYRGAATVPVALSSVRGDTKCGLVMIWTSRGGRRAP